MPLLTVLPGVEGSYHAELAGEGQDSSPVPRPPEPAHPRPLMVILAIDINTHPSCDRTTDPEMAFCCRSGPDFTKVLVAALVTQVIMALVDHPKKGK